VAELAETLALGVLSGGVYALLAAGLTLIFGVLRIVNVAQGAFLVMVAALTWWLWTTTGLDPIAAAVLTTPAMFGLGWLLYRVLLTRIRDASPSRGVGPQGGGAGSSMSVLLTFGLALTIEGVLNVTIGNRFRSVTPSYHAQSFHIGALTLPKAQVYGFLAAVAVLALLYLGLTRTWAGRAVRACAQNPSGAALVGVSATGTAALAFAIGAGTAGVGGSVLSVLTPFFPASHYDWISRLLGIIVLGGMGSAFGALVAALVLGIAETTVAAYASLQWSTLVFYLVILVVLLVRPQGLFGTRLREDIAQ
jgi:branched-chain amino acid transport system permease protein